ncbi:MAG: YkgJ family cysteine cluster protein [Dehalococcoidales bacterium]|nr:YkgJ family cysteine cluster protein [Dehalococcoidales bacterium]
MMWNKATLKSRNLETALAVTGKCNHCHQCCGCWIYDQPDQPGDVPPKRGWCPDLDLETRTCRIWDERPEGCRGFPTERDFELGAVPESCAFILVKGGKQDG